MKKFDPTGRDRILSNLLHSWGGYFVFFVAGFIMPRLMDRYVGQFNLGIWDFAWSIMTYLTLTRLDIGSAINRYVAKYKAVGDIENLTCLISTVICLQLITASIVLVATALIVWWLPFLFAGKLGEGTGMARWVITFLGISLAIRMANGTSSGILSGCHRWDLHNKILATTRAAQVILMGIALYLGAELPLLAFIVLFISIVAEWQRYRLSRRLIPEVHIGTAHFSWAKAKEVIRFGLKTVIIDLPPLYLVQTTNILIASQLGPAQLAVFARSVALVRHVESFVAKFAFILAPTAGALQAVGKSDELRDFFLKSSRYGVAFATPLLVFLIINGDAVLQVWMGKDYAFGCPLAILALGYLLPTSQNTVREILKGMNLHGRIGGITLITSVICFGTILLLTWRYQLTLTTAAVLIAVPLSLSLGILPAFYACKNLNIQYSQYLKHTLTGPFLCNVVFGFCLWFFRFFYTDDIILYIFWGTFVGGALLLILYLKFIFPPKSLSRIFKKI